MSNGSGPHVPGTMAYILPAVLSQIEMKVVQDMRRLAAYGFGHLRMTYQAGVITSYGVETTTDPEILKRLQEDNSKKLSPNLCEGP